MMRTRLHTEPPWRPPAPRALPGAPMPLGGPPASSVTQAAAAPPPLTPEVWSADELLRRAGRPKSDLALCCGWTWTRSVRYKQLVADLRSYDGLRTHPAFRRPAQVGSVVRDQLFQLRAQLLAVHDQAQRYLATPGQRRYRVIADFAHAVRHALSVQIAATAELPPDEALALETLSLHERLVRAGNRTGFSEPARQQYYEIEMRLLDERVVRPR